MLCPNAKHIIQIVVYPIVLTVLVFWIGKNRTGMMESLKSIHIARILISIFVVRLQSFVNPSIKANCKSFLKCIQTATTEVYKFPLPTLHPLHCNSLC